MNEPLQIRCKFWNKSVVVFGIVEKLSHVLYSPPILLFLISKNRAEQLERQRQERGRGRNRDRERGNRATVKSMPPQRGGSSSNHRRQSGGGGGTKRGYNTTNGGNDSRKKKARGYR